MASENVDGVKLLQDIANKENNPEAAEKSFCLFCSYFEDKIKLKVEILASKYGYNENVAFEAIQCTFNKVWLYPTFSMSKSKCKNEENAIIIWLIKIAFSQMCQYMKSGICAKVTQDEDLSVIENAEDFISYHIVDLPLERKLDLIRIMNDKISKLDEKHRVIYLTYKAYQTSGKKLPRKLLDKLRKRLGVTQATIRVYKKEACELLNDSKLLKA